jgi:LL-diaminopimelate aminotransferase
MKINRRLAEVKDYHFKTIDDIKEKMILQGKAITDLGIGDSDIEVDTSIIDGLIYGLKQEQFNKYPPYDGIIELKKGIIKYYKDVYSVNIDIEEVLILIGSKEGISNLIPATCNIGDYVIIPELRYPVYEMCSYLWGSNPYKITLEEKNNYLVDLRSIPKGIIDRSSLMILNYPNNPTGAIANREFYEEILKYCIKNQIVLCNDGAYNEIIKENEEPISILQCNNGKNAIEFGTFSKTYSMSGFRIGYAVGNKEVLKSLLKVKSNLDSSQFKAIQYAAINALKLQRSYIEGVRKIYDERREVTHRVLDSKGIEYYKEGRTFYIWCKVPNGYTSEEFCRELISSHGIIVTPGHSFGDLSNKYFRISLTQDKEIIYNALNKLNEYNQCV